MFQMRKSSLEQENIKATLQSQSKWQIWPMLLISRQIISYNVLHSFDALLENHIQVHIIFA